MSVFVTTLGATDNEICAPISQCIINSLTNHGFRFKGIPAVEANIRVRENKVDFKSSDIQPFIRRGGLSDTCLQR